MPGLVKVGGTAGDPAKRARKLSANTNMPIPFGDIRRRGCQATYTLERMR
jgi:hypothetical protein